MVAVFACDKVASQCGRANQAAVDTSTWRSINPLCSLSPWRLLGAVTAERSPVRAVTIVGSPPGNYREPVPRFRLIDRSPWTAHLVEIV